LPFYALRLFALLYAFFGMEEIWYLGYIMQDKDFFYSYIYLIAKICLTEQKMKKGHGYFE